jgi:diguanylate cyclase (GGDEF)-like protein
MNKRYKMRLVASCMMGVMAVLASVHALVFVFGREDIQSHLESSSKALAASVAQMVAMDAEGYRKFLAARDAESAYYKKMQDRLAAIKRENANIRYIYTERRLDAKSTEFILDAEPAWDPRHSPPGSDDTNNPKKEMVFTSSVTVGHRSSPGDKWGRLITAYSPILGDDGENLGLAGVDMDGGHLYRQLRRVSRAVALVNLVIICLSLAFILGFSDTILDRLLKDKLTGAFAKRHFDALLDGEILRSVKHRRGLALMMLDLDHFKRVNDTYGHAFGDRVLAAASEAIRASVRPDDTFVRYGGEEFAVIVAGATPKGALDAAERVRRAVEAAPVFNEETNAMVQMTLSIGVANFADPSQSAAYLLEGADRALYRAKAKRNAVAVFEDDWTGGGRVPARGAVGAGRGAARAAT